MKRPAYAWVIAILGILLTVASIPGQTAGVSVFTKDLMASYNVSRSSLSLTYMIGTILSALVLPFAGRALDRYGSRVMSLVAGGALSFFLIVLALGPGLLREFQGDYERYIYLTLAFFGIRHFGQGQLTMIGRTMIGRWFDKNLGLVTGVSGVVVSFSFGVAPLLLITLIETFGWVEGMKLLMIFTLATGILGAFFLREEPKILPAKPDGSKTPLGSKRDFSLKDAQKTLTFWIFSAGLTLQAMLITSFTFHFSGILTEQSIGSKEGFAIFLPIALIATIVTFAASTLADRVSLKPYLILMMGALGLAPLLVPFMHERVSFYAIALFFGLSSGLFNCLITMVWPRFFGRSHLGSISGFSTGCVVFGSAVGPYLTSLLLGTGLDLSWAFFTLSLLPLSLGLISVMTLKRWGSAL